MSASSDGAIMGGDYSTPAYASNFVVRNFRNAPRFGHSRESSEIFSQDLSNRTDYIVGTIFIGGVCISIFLLWVVILLLFIYLGPVKVGYLSGFPVVIPPKEQLPGIGKCKSSRKPMIVRTVSLISCSTIMAMAFFSYYFGFKEIRDCFDTVSSDILVRTF